MLKVVLYYSFNLPKRMSKIHLKYVA
jgi:hypothetical protein